MPNSPRTNFAAKLNAERLRRHLSLRDVASLAGVPKTTAHGWMTGEHFPTPALRSRYLALVSALGLDAELPDGIWDPAADSIGARAAASPYLGLRSFGVSDRDRFYGRTAQIDALAKAVADLDAAAGHGLLALLGPSGSGKSSLLRAGLIAGECVDGLLAGWSVRELQPTDLANLDPVDTEGTRLFVIDQFEDLLRLPADDLEAGLSRMAVLAGRAIVLISLRSDAFELAGQVPLLRAALSRPVLVAPLTRSELREVITGPPALLGAEVEPELVRVLENELAPGKAESVGVDVLPLLSTALLLTWERGRGRRMSVADYIASGGVAQAVDSQAERAFIELDPAGRATAERLFLRLLRVGEQGAYREPLPSDGLSAAEMAAIRGFVDARLLTIGDGSIRISHDALLKHWARLSEWIQARSDDLHVHDRIRTATAMWLESNRTPELLLPVGRLGALPAWLGDAEQLALLSPTEHEYIAASDDHFADQLAKERATNAKLRARGRVGIALTALAACLALVAGVLYVRAEGFAAAATSAQLSAESRQVATAARSLRSKDANLEGQMALVAGDLDDTLEARSALLDAASDDVPVRWLGKPSAVLAVDHQRKLIARADGAGGVTLWRGDEVTANPGHTFAVDPSGGALYAVALTHSSGRDVLAVGGTAVAGLWDVTAEPRQLADFTVSGVTTYAAAFAADARTLAIGGSDGSVRVFEVAADGQVGAPNQLQINPAKPAGQPAAVSAIAFDDGGMLWVGGLPDAIKRWHLWRRPGAPISPQELPNLTYHYGSSPLRALGLAVTADGSQVAAGTTANAVLRWSLTDEGLLPAKELAGFDSWVNDVAFSSDGDRLVVGSSDQTVRIFEAGTGAPLQTFTGPALVTGADLVGNDVVAVGSDGALRVWKSPSRTLRTGGDSVYNLVTDGTGSRWLAGGTLGEGALLWRLGKDAAPQPVDLSYPELSGARSAAVAIAPNGRFLVAGSKGGEIVSWPLTDTGVGQPRIIDSGVGYLSCLTISPDSGLVAAMGYGGERAAVLRAGADGTLSKLTEVDAIDAQMGSFSADSSMLVIALASNRVDLWSGLSSAKPTLAGSITGFETATIAVATAPRSRLLVVGEDSGHVSVWSYDDPSRPARSHDFGDAHGSAYALTFSPDEQTLAMASGDDMIWGFTLATGSTSAGFALAGELERPWDVRFLDGGATLAAAGNNGRVRTWPSTVAAARAQQCARRGDQLTDLEWKQYLPGIEPRDPCR